jgi:hypothetical protein
MLSINPLKPVSMQTRRLLLLIIYILSISVPAVPQAKKYVIGLSYGFQYQIEDIWVGDPYNIWIDQTSSSIIEGFVYYKLSPLFQTGLYCDFESGLFDLIYLPEQKATRLGFGTLWLGHYPDKKIQFQLGGYFGYNTAFPDYDDIGSRGGIDYGIIAGPAFEYHDFGIAVHIHSGFSWYPKKEGNPDEFSYANSKLKIKIYYNF